MNYFHRILLAFYRCKFVQSVAKIKKGSLFSKPLIKIMCSYIQSARLPVE